ncbi:hypothetical protein KP509_04G104900 [Ceratopteris richardii]|uniref:glutamine--tRNA ligase n=2 Tax=Ceratopteris richardii TaxID=49495 RepID=A0A8T2V384_CERRI|nr:hypothetical protein KP509_04G104900 [Ceratopteris richardii]
MRDSKPLGNKLTDSTLKQPAMPGLANAEDEAKLFLSIGLDQRTATNALANAKVTSNLSAVIHEAEVEGGCDKAIGNLLYMVATKFPNNALNHRAEFLKYITSGQIKNAPQLEAAFSFFSSIGPSSFDEKEFEKNCGVGVEVSVEEISKVVEAVIEECKSQILAERYRINVGILLGKVRKELPWADGKTVKEEMDTQLRNLLGEKTEKDDEKPIKKKKEKAPKSTDADLTTQTPSVTQEVSNPFSDFPDPQKNIQVHQEIFFSDGTIWRPKNTAEKLEKHLQFTGRSVYTRFPPEPNGYLHIGHAKAMFVSFGLAKERGGYCYLRYDDTNPEAEKQEYIDHIQEIVDWMGWKPFKVTYSSDYFQELYDLAIQLIKKGYAYVDHQTPEEIKSYRESKTDSPWRNRPIAESLKLFEEMRKGMIDEGKATLRMKQDMKSENPNMYDLIAYRIKFTPHPHAGDKWCIYPSYDYTHCIVDSLENITHSLCTLEFEIRRPSYYWLLEALDLYHPHVWEYSRLSITNTVLSKRKLNRLVREKWVDGWDDPRLMTLAGLRRRGYTPDAINAFVRDVGITRSDGSLIRLEKIEHYIREDLNKKSRRVMVVLKPLKVVIKNMEENVVMNLRAKFWPDAADSEESSHYEVPFSRVVYIESSDFRLKDSKDYYGLAPGKTVMLRYAFPIKCVDIIYAEDKSTVLELHAEYDPAKSTKPKGVIHWVSEPSHGILPLKVEVRMFEKLFLSENPSELEDWLADLNPNSKIVIAEALAVPVLKHSCHGDSYQFERLGYFCVDQDSSADKLVFNRTVSLRDSYVKVSGK